MSLSSSPSPLQAYLHARLREAFGPPHRTMGRDDHWQLRCSGSSVLNMLINGIPENPAVWLFGLHEDSNEVFSQSMKSEQQVDEIIIQIQARIKQ